ncbi:MAG TPA: hypothetical protein VNM48_06515, partial [Chloroflexota bacterium]|nr:hypothetical protein [Chloroflexota bacterium]
MTAMPPLASVTSKAGKRSIISAVTALHLPGTRYPWVFLRIETESGLYGIGQVSSGPNSTVVAAAASRLGTLLIGEDASRIEYL